jgi:hypothetical protein
MEDRRRRDKDGIEVGALKKFAVISIVRHFSADQIVHLAESWLIDIADGGNLYSWSAQELPYQLLSAAAWANHADIHTIIGRDGRGRLMLNIRRLRIQRRRAEKFGGEHTAFTIVAQQLLYSVYFLKNGFGNRVSPLRPNSHKDKENIRWPSRDGGCDTVFAGVNAF